MPIIEVEGLAKSYGDHVALRDVTFSVEEGEIFGILGRNGAGKTTTVECLEGLRQADSGRISVLGMDPSEQSSELRGQLGVQLQESALPDNMKVWEALDLYSSFHKHPADWNSLLDEWGLAEKRGARFGKLSGGQKQRLFIALALVGNPRVAILDELTTGLDPQARRDTWQLVERIRDKGVTVLLVTHFMDEAERLCDRVAVFHDGRVAAVDSPGAIVAGRGSGQRVSFTPSEPVGDDELLGLPDVTGVERKGELITVSGTGDLLQVVTTALARKEVVPKGLQVHQAGLEDAFLALTGAATTDETEESAR
ncbi:ABC-2 type transport system ATP-binding protein [Prauserella aidingensis]|uniref:ABC transporter ATP-binding protein n=1 Tax=Prauserella aidingensis TaxID=387890 RepID=UPI0020A2F14A|nr:ABC transporter ATP-binding protein [Prauserella aidingensis]MCP2253280.1 ABC-2 type transport system ATP-binding protein [Prauserella aidingensis]